jgi:hypothetical protein
MPSVRPLIVAVAAALAGGVLTSDALAVAIVRSASGSAAGSVSPTVDIFRADLGGVNNGVGGSFASGRREINWDAVPNTFAAPNNLPANFFNANSPRGAVLATPGNGFQVSGDGVAAMADFANINPEYAIIFDAFTPSRLFTALGSTITDVTFFLPGTSTPARVNGFGAVFSDVDLANVSSIEYFDAADASLGKFFVPNVAGSETFSFLGVSFSEGAIVSRVRITSGNQVLSSTNNTTDLVVMDDFIYGEPQAQATVIPLPAAAWAGALLLGGVVGRRALRRIPSPAL